MILLFVASLASWIVILEKTAIIRKASRIIWAFKRTANELDDVVDPEEFPGFSAAIVDTGVRESLDHAGGETRADYRERVERSMRAILSGRLDRIESRVNFLATVGATSPFVGLFGTVWGIMHSFLGIAQSGETTLAVVAPGIAEALFATAMGLVAAIPAVIAYNKINSTFKKMAKEALVAIGLVGNSLARIHFGTPDDTQDKPLSRRPSPPAKKAASKEADSKTWASPSLTKQPSEG
jgi:biopolymer transport protein ExbB/TolQ